MSPFDKQSSEWLTLPKVGESYDYSQHGKIVEIKKIEEQKGYNFVKKEKLILPDGQEVMTEKNLGYRYVILFADKLTLSVSSWAPYYAMQKAGIIEGCSMIIDHKEKGTWVVTKLA